MKSLRLTAAFAALITAAACSESNPPAPPPPPIETPSGDVQTGPVASRLELRDDLRELWTQHMFWIRNYLVDATDELPSQGATLERLLQNQVALGDAIRPFYGDAAGNQLTALLTTHIEQAGALIDAAKQNDTAVVEQLTAEWRANAEEISNFLADANPNLPREEVKAMMQEHLDTTLIMVVARLEGEWEADVAAYDAALEHMLMLSDALTDGLIAQFPELLSEPQESQNEQGLHLALRKLWDDHITWTRLFVISDVEELSDVLATTNRLLKNQADLGDALKPWYGIAAGTQLTALLTEHITGAVDVLHAAKDGDLVALEAANLKWQANADEIAVFLARANPFLDEVALKDMLRLHLDQLLAQASARLSKDYVAEIAAYDEGQDHILHLADVLSDAIDQQFPAGPNLGQ